MMNDRQPNDVGQVVGGSVPFPTEVGYGGRGAVPSRENFMSIIPGNECISSY